MMSKPVRVNRNPTPEGGNGLHKALRQMIHKARHILGLRPPTFKESLEEVIEEHDLSGEEKIPVEEKTLLRNVLSFSGLTVGDIMIPRSDIVFVNDDVTLDELRMTILEKTHTRIPVCREDSLDDVIGFLHIKDLVSVLCKRQEFNLHSLLRKALFVPTAMKISNLLRRMRSARVHMAMVVDEFGGTAGIVTLEDVMEEIVGEIEDEHDIDDEANMVRLSEDTFDANARIEISVLERKLGTRLRAEGEIDEYDTLGGMIFAMLGRVPARGEVIKHRAGYEFEILEADLRRIKRVLIRSSVPKNIGTAS